MIHRQPTREGWWWADTSDEGWEPVLVQRRYGTHGDFVFLMAGIEEQQEADTVQAWRELPIPAMQQAVEQAEIELATNARIAELEKELLERNAELARLQDGLNMASLADNAFLREQIATLKADLDAATAPRQSRHFIP